jgi:hypothetical protein
MWSRFSGISCENADDYINKFTLGDIVGGKIPTREIESLKLATGRKVSKKIVRSLTSINRQTEVKLLASIPGISQQIATEIISHAQLGRLLTYGVTGIAMIRVGKSKRCFGEIRANNVLKYFNYKQQTIEQAPPENQNIQLGCQLQPPQPLPFIDLHDRDIALFLSEL